MPVRDLISGLSYPTSSSLVVLQSYYLTGGLPWRGSGAGVTAKSADDSDSESDSESAESESACSERGTRTVPSPPPPLTPCAL